MDYYANGAMINNFDPSQDYLRPMTSGILMITASNEDDNGGQYILCSYSPHHLTLLENVIISYDNRECFIKEIGVYNNGGIFLTPNLNKGDSITINYLGILKKVSEVNSTESLTKKPNPINTTEERRITGLYVLEYDDGWGVAQEEQETS